MENDEKPMLELKKLALEIADLERPWWKRPAYVLAALPTVLAIIALSVGFLNGFFSAQLTKLDNQRHDLEAQVREFETTRNSLFSQNQKLQQEIVAKQEILNEIKETSSRLNVVLLRLAIIDSPSADPETPEQRRKFDAESRAQAKSELEEVIVKLNKILTDAGVDTKPKSPGTVDIRVGSEPATIKPPQRRKKK